jgi:thiosulfate reductase cytochrome b subunit
MKRIYLHPLPVRIWHWANALAVIALLATGFYLRVSGVASLAPRDPYLVLHKWAGVTAMALWIFWIGYTLVSDYLARHYALRRRDLGGISRQMKFYLVSIFKGEENPFRASPTEKFNSLQKLAYGSVMLVFLPAMILTGLLFLNAFFIRDTLLSWDAFLVIDTIHAAGLYVFAVFLVLHIYMAALGPTVFSHIKSMIVGYEEAKAAQVGPAQSAALAEEEEI